MKLRRRLMLVQRRTEELMVRRQRFIVDTTRRTTYKVRTIQGASGVSRRVIRSKGTVLDLHGRPLRGHRLQTERVTCMGRLRSRNDLLELARARAEVVAVLRLPLVNLMAVLKSLAKQKGNWKSQFLADLFGPLLNS